MPCVCKLGPKAQVIIKLGQNFSNRIRAKNIYPTPPLLPSWLCLSHSSQKLTHCFSWCDLNRHSSTSKNKDTQNTPLVLAIRTEEDNGGKHSDKPMTSLLNPFLYALHFRVMTPLKKQRPLKKIKKRKTDHEPPACCVSQTAPCSFSLIQDVAWK